jgi:hypothetical protein
MIFVPIIPTLKQKETLYEHNFTREISGIFRTIKIPASIIKWFLVEDQLQHKMTEGHITGTSLKQYQF